MSVLDVNDWNYGVVNLLGSILCTFLFLWRGILGFNFARYLLLWVGRGEVLQGVFLFTGGGNGWLEREVTGGADQPAADCLCFWGFLVMDGFRVAVAGE